MGLLNPQEIAQARNWINTQWGGDGSIPGYGAAFNGDVYDPSNRLRNQAVLGAGQAMGYDADAMSQILNHTAGDITAMGQKYQPQSNIWADIFRADNPGVGAQSVGGNPMVNDFSRHSTFTNNPYAGGMGDEIARRQNMFLTEQALPAIRSNAVGNGSLGGSRQGVAEGIAIRGAADGLTGGLSNLFGGLYESGQNRDLQRYGIDTNAYLGNQGQMLGFFGQQRGQDLQQLGLGADLYSRGLAGEWSPIQQAGGAYAPFSGYGTTTNSGQSGGGWGGAVGGALGAGQLAKNFGWW